VAEALGWPANRVREELSPLELCEWAVYLNTPFSLRSRSALENGWLVQTVRSIVASKTHRPKFTDSVFPYDKVYKSFFVKPPDQERRKRISDGSEKVLKTPGEVMHLAQVKRMHVEKVMRLWQAGKLTNSAGLKRGEVMPA